MNDGFLDQAHAIARRAAHAAKRHPRRVAAAVGALLLCAGGGAFAVAQLGPDAAQLPVRLVLQAVQPAADIATAAVAEPLRLYRSDRSRSSDTADSLLQRLGVNDPAAAAFLRRDERARQAVLGRAGRLVSAEASEDQALRRLTVRWAGDTTATYQRLVVERTSAGEGAAFTSRLETLPTRISSWVASGIVQSTLAAAAEAAELPEGVAQQLADVFPTQLDWKRGLRRGDRFAVSYEAVEADGEMLQAGRLLGASFTHGGKTHEAMWFADQDGAGGYYTLEGKGMAAAFLPAPLDHFRVSSGFSARFHPLFREWREHLGTDFAAPVGTPVHSVADGVVEFAGVQNGYGNVVLVKHRNSHVTLYAHLNRIGVRPGQAVHQGEMVGEVGQTGWATGPHLHFEYRVDGVQQDPMEMARSSLRQELTARQRPAFRQLAAVTRLELQAAMPAAGRGTVAVAAR